VRVGAGRSRKRGSIEESGTTGGKGGILLVVVGSRERFKVERLEEGTESIEGRAGVNG